MKVRIAHDPINCQYIVEQKFFWFLRWETSRKFYYEPTVAGRQGKAFDEAYGEARRLLDSRVVWSSEADGYTE